MKKETSKSTTRATILQAANKLIVEQGVAHLTLDAVAEKAGVSKGGLLYHFPSKEALITGLISSLVEQFDTDLAQQLQNSKQDRGQWLAAYIKANAATTDDLIGAGPALLAAVATNPQLLEPLQASFAQYQQQAEAAGIDPALATIIRLAVDGLWLADLFQLAAPQGALRTQVIEKLITLSQGDHSTASDETES